MEDTGRGGIPDKLDIFQKGISTKSDNRGIGLYNLSMALKKLNGEIKTSVSNRLGGAHFSVRIPVKRQT